MTEEAAAAHASLVNLTSPWPAHPLYSSGFQDTPGSHTTLAGALERAFTAKLDPAGLAALQEFLEQRGHVLPKLIPFPEAFGKPILVALLLGDTYRFAPNDLREVLERHALTNESARETQFLFGVLCVWWVRKKPVGG